MTQQPTGRRAKAPAKMRTIPDAVDAVASARKMSEMIIGLESARQRCREAHDSFEVMGEAVRQKCRDAGAWPKGWDNIPESRRWRKLALEAAGDLADAADAVDALIVRAQRVMEDLNRGSKGRQKFDATQ